MENRTLLLLVLAFVLSNTMVVRAQITVNVWSNGFEFSPDEIHVSSGDTINFNIESFHDAVEVSEETWNADDTESNGGFQLPFGGGKIVLTEVGKYYFVCTPHVSLGMKGIIFVEEPSSISSYNDDNDFQLSLFPNPSSHSINFSFMLEKSSFLNIELIDMTGRIVNVFIRENYQPGGYNEIFNIDHLQPGRYIVKLKTETDNFTESLIIIE